MAEPASRPLRAREHAALAAFVLAAWGLVEGARISPRAAAVAAAMLLLAGAVLGVVQAGVLAALRGLWRRADLPAADPERRVATLVAAALCGGLALALLRPLVLRLLDVHDPQLVAALVVVAVAGAGVAVALATPVAAGLLRAPLRELQRSVDLPLPRRPAAQWLTYAALPLALASLWLLRRHARALGPFAPVFAAAILPAAELAVLVLGGLLPAAARARLRAASGAVLLAALVAAALVLAVVDLDPKQRAKLGRSDVAGAVQRQLRRLSDLDGDGASAWLGGGDCAGLDATRGPRARDIPGNGVDEDCDGADARPRPSERPSALERTHGLLEPGTVRDYNVVWVIVDAVRHNHLSMHGYPRRTTPYLEVLAGESLVFRRAYSQSSATMLSIPSMLAGRYVGAMTWSRVGDRLEAVDADEPLAAVLQRHGYRTGFVVDGYVTGRLPAVLDGFEEVESTWIDGQSKPWNTRYAGTAVTKAIEFLERDSAAAQPFFLAIYMADPHAPYVEHPEVPSFGRGSVARYDNEIAYTDRWIGFLVEYLRAKPPLLDDTIVVVVADHGEEFGDHGGVHHARTCHEESVHVPLLLRVPGLAPGVVDRRVALVDVVPTLAELLGLDLGDAPLDGQSLLIPALAPERAPTDRPIFCSVLSQRASQGDFIRHAVRVGRHGLHEDALERRAQLFDLEADPKEKSPLDLRDPTARATAEYLARLLRGSLTGNLETQTLTR
jgi:arylsulfatase A-like enzyme